MQLDHLHIEHFRNLSRVELTPGPRFNVLTGPNGQGKTNLLEAIYTLGSVKSLRAQRNAELIQWEQERAVIEGEISREAHRRQARIEIGATGKRVVLNGSLVRSIQDYFGTLSAVVFSPDDLGMLKGGPSERRRFLDRAVFNTRAGYLADVQAYESVLRQRNAVLKSPSPSAGLLEVYDEQLADYGASITQRRLEYLRDFFPIFRRAFRGIFTLEGEVEASESAQIAATLTLGYGASWWAPAPVSVSGELEVPSLEALRTGLGSALRRGAREDMRRGTTCSGPHRDDLHLAFLEREVRSFASQGQLRAIVLAMKIAEIQVLTERLRFTPVLLLDDVSSELDRERNRLLFELLKRHPGQVFITTTHRDFIQLEGEDVRSWSVRQGTLEPR